METFNLCVADAQGALKPFLSGTLRQIAERILDLQQRALLQATGCTEIYSTPETHEHVITVIETKLRKKLNPRRRGEKPNAIKVSIR